MGERGPIPKRESQRRRANKPETPVTHAPSGGTDGYERPEPAEDWHPLAARWWNALAKSGQSAFYQPSDWEHANVWAHLLSLQLWSGKPSAMLLAAWDSASTRLLITEGDRRRLRLELDRGVVADPDEAVAVASMAAWRGKRTGTA